SVSSAAACPSSNCTSDTNCPKPTSVPVVATATKIPTQSPISTPNPIMPSPTPVVGPGQSAACKAVGGTCLSSSFPQCPSTTAVDNSLGCPVAYYLTAAVQGCCVPANKPIGALCTYDSQCNSGNCMKYANEPKRCVAKLANGENCNVASNCDSGRCVYVNAFTLKCAPLPDGTICQANETCASGICYMGKCEPSKPTLGTCSASQENQYRCDNGFSTSCKKTSDSHMTIFYAWFRMGDYCTNGCDTTAGANFGKCKPAPSATPIPTVAVSPTATPTPSAYTCTKTAGQHCFTNAATCTENGGIRGTGTCQSNLYCCKTTIAPTATPTPKSPIPPSCDCVAGKWTGSLCTDESPEDTCGIVTPPATCDPAKYKGDKSGDIWLHFDDSYTAGCICGGDYHYVCANQFWACGDGRKDTNCPSCIAECPDRNDKSLLLSCTPSDSDGTTLAIKCSGVGLKASCGGKTYCCPSVGAEWTTDLSKCDGGGTCTQCAGKPDAKVKGDADCSGATNINDASIWRSEFIEGELGTVIKNSWNADFDCNGKVNLNDISIWRDNFIKGL
ncbi:MAG: hypothetical protein US68_C0005G0001, partial [Candidatus Shapirobacteria bacterium GW2011_GWE1_38_10]